MRGSRRAVRWWRLSHFRRNPLVRAVDRVESLFLALVVGLLALAVPLAVLAGLHSSATLHARARVELAHRHPVTATLLADAPVAGLGSATNNRALTVPAVWPGGSGRVQVAPTATKGEHTRIWLDRRGEVVPAPLTATDASVGAVCTGTLTWLAIAGGAWALFTLVRAVLDRGRYLRWSREWLLFDTSNHSGPRHW